MESDVWKMHLPHDLPASGRCDPGPYSGHEQGKTANCLSAWEAVRAAEKVSEKTKNHRRIGVCDADGQTP